MWSDLNRGGRVFLFLLPLSFAGVTLFSIVNPMTSPDVMVTVVAIPLMVSYLMLRLIVLVASGISEPSEAELRAVRAAGQSATTVKLGTLVTTLGIVFFAGMWIAVAGLASALLYAVLDLQTASKFALSLVRWIFLGVAVAAVFICLVSMCRFWLLKIAKVSRDLFNNPSTIVHGRARAA